MTFWKNESGGVSSVFAAMLVGMVSVGGAALVYSEASGGRTELQNAMDSAALAGATLPRSATASERIDVATRTFHSNYNRNRSPDLTLVSVRFSAIDQGASSASIEVGVDGRAQAHIRNRFASVLGGPNVPFDANASARKSVSDPVCVLALNPTSRSFDVNGRAQFTASNCAAMSNSKNEEGMKQDGPGFAKATQLGVAGNASGTGWSPNPTPGVDRMSDPLATVPFPAPERCVEGVDQRMQQSAVTLPPGTYCGGLLVKADSNVRLSPGIYVMKDGPLRIDAGATVSGEEVMIAFWGADSTLYLSSGGTLNITSPRTGIYTNMQMMSDRSLSASKKNEEWFTVLGGGRLTFDGTIYLPEQQVLISGASKDAVVVGRSASMIAVADAFWFQGNAVIDFKQENLRALAFDAPSGRFIYGSKLVR